MVVPSMVVTDMMGEMDQDMLSLNTLLTPSLTDYTLQSHHTTLSVHVRTFLPRHHLTLRSVLSSDSALSLQFSVSPQLG